MKADIKKELKIGDDKVLKEVDSGVVENTPDTNEEQLAEYSEDDNTTEEKSQEKSDTEEVKSNGTAENITSEGNLVDMDDNKVESAVEHETQEEKVEVHETIEKKTDEPEKKDEPSENKIEKGDVENDTATEDSK